MRSAGLRCMVNRRGEATAKQMVLASYLEDRVGRGSTNENEEA